MEELFSELHRSHHAEEMQKRPVLVTAPGGNINGPTQLSWNVSLISKPLVRESRGNMEF